MEDKPMTSKIIAAFAAFALALGAAPLASAATMQHNPVHKGKVRYYSHPKGAACKGEFMFMKGGKCMDARNKPATA
jgi:hypothetical protein